MLVNSRQLSSNAPVMLVCLDVAVGQVLEGRIYNCYYRDPLFFCGLSDLVFKIDRLLDELQFPQAYLAHRYFFPPPEDGEKPARAGPVRSYWDRSMYQLQCGVRSSFIIHVVYRQNASWQGHITWLDRKKNQHFRSVLELMHLVKEAANLLDIWNEKKLPVPAALADG